MPHTKRLHSLRQVILNPDQLHRWISMAIIKYEHTADTLGDLLAINLMNYIGVCRSSGAHYRGKVDGHITTHIVKHIVGERFGQSIRVYLLFIPPWVFGMYNLIDARVHVVRFIVGKFQRLHLYCHFDVVRYR